MPKISELPAGSALAGTEPAPVVQAGATVQVPASYYKDLSLEDFSANGLTLVTLTYANMRAALDLEAGTDFNAYSANLAGLSALASTGVIARTGAGTYAGRTLTAGTGISIADGDGVAGNPTITCTVAGLSDGDKGDITVSSSGTVWTIDSGVVTLAKIAVAAANSKLLGSGAAGSGSAYAELTLGTGLSFSGTTLNVSGFATTGAIGSSGLTMNTARLLGRTTGSSGAVEEITVSTGLVLSATTLTADTGTSGAKIPLLNGANTHSGLATFSAGADITPAAAPSTTAVGYLGAPQNIGLDSGNVTLALTDCGKHIYHTDGNARDLTIPANGSVAFPVGTVIAGVNEHGAGVVTLKITTDTLRWGASTGQRTIAADATFSLLKVASTVWRLTGDGIT